jgi:hypothetical protein
MEEGRPKVECRVDKFFLVDLRKGCFEEERKRKLEELLRSFIDYKRER